MAAAKRHRRTRRWLERFALCAGGWILGLATVGFVALAVVEAGVYDTRASTPHPPLVAWALHTTFIHSVRLRSPDRGRVLRFSDAQARAGFQLYDANCRSCHGGPGAPRAPFAAGMTPPPPFLLDAAKTWSPTQLHLIVSDGVKMTAMPAWSQTYSDAQVWDVVAFLETLPNLSAGDYARLRTRTPPPQVAAPPGAAQSSSAQLSPMVGRERTMRDRPGNSGFSLPAK